MIKWLIIQYLNYDLIIIISLQYIIKKKVLDIKFYVLNIILIKTKFGLWIIIYYIFNINFITVPKSTFLILLFIYIYLFIYYLFCDC